MQKLSGLQNRKFKIQSTIGFRFGLRLGVVLFIVLTLFMSAILWARMEKAKDLIENEINQLKEFSQVSLANAMWTLNKASIMSICNGMEKTQSEFVVGFEVYDSENQLIFKTKSLDSIYGREREKNSHSINLEKIPSQTFSINYNQEKIGDLRIYTAYEKISHEILQDALMFIALFFMIAMLLFLIIRSLSEQTVTRPILELLHSMNQSSRGQFDEVPLEDFKYEIKELAVAYNQAVIAIRQRDQALSNHNERLEADVFKKVEELDQARAINIQSSKLAALGEMAAGIAHEVNNPLAVIVSANSLNRRFIQKSQSLDLDVKEKLLLNIANIESTCLRIGKIIQSLLAFSRDGQKDPFEKTSIRKVILESIDLCRSKARQKNVEIKISEISENVVYPMRSIPFSQVIVNLISNAIDAIESLDEKWIRIDVNENDQIIQISVTDSGHGIEKEIAEKMMQPFFTTKIVGKGTGLGLSISYGIIKDHGGNLSINMESKNTQFLISLPKNVLETSEKGQNV